MFEVTKYEPPQLFVTDHLTGEIYEFLIGTGGVIKQEGAFADVTLVVRRSYIWL